MPLTKPEKYLVYLLRLWILAFTITIAIFLFIPNHFFEVINQFSLKFLPSLSPIPVAQEKFWMVLTLSLMFTLVFMCLSAQNNIKRNHLLINPILVSKFISTLFFFVFFIFYQKSLAYLVGVFTDGFVFIVTFLAYQKAKPYLTLS